MTTPEYDWWCGKRINDNILVSSQENTRSIEEHLQVIPSELEILEVEEMRKGKNKTEEDFGSLKTYYKKLHLLMRIVGLGKTSEQWRKEIQEENIRADQWEKKFQDAQVAELERSLHQYRSHNSLIELKASLTEIEELKRKIEELEAALQNCQIRDRDHIMGEVVTQVREVADHLQTLAVQAEMLSLRYESKLDRGRELAWFLRKVKALSIRARPYM
ncbi:hypothetical protein Godav_019558 [Gossypium davidsonii]|uniref:Uncharacterized protein n=2 Tax=Gossypium TaxID=3633 RepID=A0A7J8R1I9_GOSDV|nr:hypothetical protein [Gossypium davidsonii]MBA0642191.1 hypothetical protein [Gossypium klotzschianum]